MAPQRAVAIALACLLSLASGCTRKAPGESTPPASIQSDPALSSPDSEGPHARIGRPELAFDYEAVATLVLIKANPVQADHWSARLVRKENPSSSGQFAWFIENGPTDRKLADRWANGPFILHLLDTIRTVQAKEAPFSGTPDSFGLAHPWYDLRWYTGSTGSGGQENEREIALGAPAKDSDGNFSGLYGEILKPFNPRIYTLNGALLKMLELLPNFNAIRLPRLATFDADDVDEIEVFRGARKVFYAQREGGSWTDAHHRAHARDVDGWLEAITHLRIQRFVDDAAEADQALRQGLKHPAWGLRFKGKNLKPVVIGLNRRGVVEATVSTRPDSAQNGKTLAVFELYPQARNLASSLLEP